MADFDTDLTWYGTSITLEHQARRFFNDETANTGLRFESVSQFLEIVAGAEISISAATFKQEDIGTYWDVNVGDWLDVSSATTSSLTANIRTFNAAPDVVLRATNTEFQTKTGNSLGYSQYDDSVLGGGNITMDSDKPFYFWMEWY